MSFVFYDTETTGTNTVFDQILQFAAIRTDEELAEVERFDIRCRLLPHVVPSPEAMRVTGTTVARLLNADLPSHYVMVRSIREKLLSCSPALFIGYNSVSFDEHLLRQAFYQTLHPPYLTSTGGNCRADALRLVRAAALFFPGSIMVPQDDSGMPSFRLEAIARANGLGHRTPHDAIGDVEATVHLCKLLSERLPDLWSSFLRFTQKAVVVDHVNSEDVFCLADFYGGVPYAWLVTSLGASTSRKSDMLVFDLATDPEELRVLPDVELVGRLAQSPRIVRRLRTNACPIILPKDMAPDITVAKALSDAELNQRLVSLRSDPEYRRRLISAFEQGADEFDPWQHVEQQIQDAFISDADEAILNTFHAAPWDERLGLLEALEDVRLKQLGRRLIFFERPEVLPASLRQKMTIGLAKRVIDGDGSGTWLCLQQAIVDIDDLLSTTREEQQFFLQEHRSYLAKRLVELSAHLD